MEPLFPLSDGRIVVIDQGGLPGGGGVVNLLRVFRDDGSEITTDAIAFGDGTVVGDPDPQVVNFSVQELASGQIRVISEGHYGASASPTVYTFDVDPDTGTVTGMNSYFEDDYASVLEMPYGTLGASNQALVTLPSGNLAATQGQLLIVTDADGVYITHTLRDGPVESVNDSALILTSGGRLLRVTHVNSADGGDVEIRAQFYNTDGSRDGAEILIEDNLSYVTGHWDVEVTELSDGRLAVAYATGVPMDEDESESAVYLTLLNADGSTQTPRQLVNTGDVSGAQDWVRLWPLPEGGVAVTYGTSTGFTPSSSLNVRFFDQDGAQFTSFQQLGVNGRGLGDMLHVSQTGLITLLDVNGAEVLHDETLPGEPGLFGDEIILSTQDLGELAEDPETATLADGTVVVVWDHTNLTGHVALYDPDTGAVTQLDPIPQNSDGVQSPTVAALPDGGFAVAWRSGEFGVTGDVQYRVYNADGSLRKDTTTAVAGEGEHVQLHPTATGFALAWVDDTGALDDDEAIQFFDAQGDALGPPIDYQPGRDVETDIDGALLSGGQLVTTWQSRDSVFVRSAFFRIWNSDGTPATDPIEVLNGVDGRLPVRVAATDDGGFVVVYVNGAAAFSMDRYDASGTHVGTVILPDDPDLPADTDSWQIAQSFDIEINGDGQLVLAYGLNTSDDRDVRFSIFSLSGSAVILGQTANENLPDHQDQIELTRLENGDVFLVFRDHTNVLLSSQSAIHGVHLQGGALPGQLIEGGNGDDPLDGTEGGDTIIGDRGNDTIDGAGGDDDVTAGTGDDSAEGGAGNDTLRGGKGEDTLIGGDGDDIMRGQSNADHMEGGDGADNIKGGGGNDTLYGGDGDDFVKGGTRRDLIDGGAGHDKLFGNSFDDTLIGGAGNDTLKAGGDNDILDGGTGDDFLKGGPGDDVFVFDVGHGMDSISDFGDGADRLEISSALAGGLDAAAIAAGATVTAAGVEISLAAGDVILLEGLVDTTGLAALIDVV